MDENIVSSNAKINLLENMRMVERVQIEDDVPFVYTGGALKSSFFQRERHFRSKKVLEVFHYEMSYKTV